MLISKVMESSLPYQRANRGGRSRQSATARSVTRSEGLLEFHSALGSTWIAIKQKQSTKKTLVNDIFIQFFSYAAKENFKLLFGYWVII